MGGWMKLETEQDGIKQIKLIDQLIQSQTNVEQEHGATVVANKAVHVVKEKKLDVRTDVTAETGCAGPMTSFC